METIDASYGHWAEWQKSAVQEGMSWMQKMANLPNAIQKARSVKKGATPSEVVYQEGHIRLLHYPSEQPARHQTPLIFVFALVNRPYILDLKENRSVVKHFVQSGFDTYLIDWGAPTDAERHLGLNDYVNGFLERIIDFTRRRTGQDKVSLLGYCMGGAMSAMYTALHQDKVANLILLAAGVNFDTEDGLLNVWSRPENFDVDAFVEAYGNCPAEFLQSSFLLLKPVQNLIQKPINFFENLDNDKFLEDFFTMETWLNDNIPVPGQLFREYVHHLYQNNRLVKGQLPIGDKIVDLKSITCPVMNLMAEADDLVPCSQSRMFNDLVGSTDRSSIELKAGHIGLAIGGKAQKEMWPQVCDWLAKRS